MNLDKFFKAQDLTEAKAEFECINNLQKIINLKLERGDYKQAHDRSVDVLRSIARLIDLNKSKQTEDALVNMIKAADIDKMTRELWGRINK